MVLKFVTVICQCKVAICYLQEQKENAAVMRKRRAPRDETEELKKKEQKPGIDTEALSAVADEFAQIAEKDHKLALIAESNA